MNRQVTKSELQNIKQAEPQDEGGQGQGQTSDSDAVTSVVQVNLLYFKKKKKKRILHFFFFLMASVAVTSSAQPIFGATDAPFLDLGHKAQGSEVRRSTD